MSCADRLGVPAALTPLSLAARLTAWYIASAFALVVIVTGSLYWVLASGLAQADDETLHDKLHVLDSLLSASHPDDTVITQEIGEDADAPRRTYVRILSGSGAVLRETPGMSAELPPAPFPAATEGANAIQGADGRPFRALAQPFTPSARGSGGIIQVATEVTQDRRLLAHYRTDLAIVLGVALLACGVGGYEIVQVGLRPVRGIVRAAAEIGASTLDKRLVTAGLPAELRSLALTFNAMLERLHGSFSRLQQFSDDIAHELRTPINRLLVASEVALTQAKTVADYRDTLASNVDACARVSQMVQNLLFLARSENPEARITRESVELAHELAAIREFYEPLASEAGLLLSVACEPDLVAEVDRSLIQRAISNLVANAIAHTPRGGSVRILVRDAGACLAIDVTDSGEGIAAEHLPHVFERFYRADQARAATNRNLGLGLAIVKSIVALHGGAVEIESTIGVGTAVTLRLPKKAAAPA